MKTYIGRRARPVCRLGILAQPACIEALPVGTGRLRRLGERIASHARDADVPLHGYGIEEGIAMGVLMMGSKGLSIILGLSIAAVLQMTRGSEMRAIEFGIGRDIKETANLSGVVSYSVQNIDGLLIYDANGLSSDAIARYQSVGYEISFSPLFSLTLYADKKSGGGPLVQTAALQASTRAITSHAAARAFVEGVIKQFQNGRWERYVENLCPAVTGRSSILDEAGRVAQTDACPLDLGYKLTDDEWKQLMQSTQSYQWIGDGVLAKFSVSYNDFGRGIDYSIDLDFDAFEQKKQRDEAENRRRLAEGDAKGWRSTEKHLRYIATAKERLVILEENAVKRGDKVVVRRGDSR